MAITLHADDFDPVQALEFQHWGERAGDGEPYSRLRPLTGEAAERAWRELLRMGAATWVECPHTAAAGDDQPAPLDRLDLRELDGWDEPLVRDWLLAREPDAGREVLACFQPRVAVAVPWGLLCRHWLRLLWTGGCVWPATGEWVLVHDGDVFAYGRRQVG